MIYYIKKKTLDVIKMKTNVRKERVKMKEEKKELILDILDVLDGLSVIEANYLLGYAKGFEAQKDLQSLMAS